ncbi:AraC-type DNA-binding protein [Actinopolymorpha cephalotaxi]|uniref:AraC-like DNA-binding protein n=1 Tax=Actinopolymorpha cephalotaxi TaxID=504797 RepID=A0A1I2TE24_9ACTN|nr:AraC family transcriptional regulator [Actinopolymorpha cephalotaxi]NYH83048.1 AraC-like DNA-binding protein [Actinopolymorpha cephalotaxi]SFG63194.1 AraC-type DNA-binding protein [Actinopolymorpha cephalotaxi]
MNAENDPHDPGEPQDPRDPRDPGDPRVTPPLLDFVLANAQIRAVGAMGSRQVRDNGYTLVRRTVPDYNLIFLRQGRVTWVLGDEPVPLAAGDLLVVPPGVPHHATPVSRRVVLGSLHVEATLAGGQDVFDLLRPPRVRTVRSGTRLAGHLRSAVAEWDRDPRLTRLTLPAWAQLVTLELLVHDAELGLLRPRPVDPVVAWVLDELTERVGRRTTLDDLAGRFGFSGQHLNRVFGRVLGVTPLQYLTRLRLDRAAAMLIDRQLTIRAVAREVGYDDPYYFSRAFRARFGRSPSEYRRDLDPVSPFD